MIDVKVLKLRPKQKKVTANMTLFLQFEIQPPTPAGVVPIPKGKLSMINTDQWEKNLIPIPTPQGETIWVNLDLKEGQQWTTVTNRKFRGKEKASPCNGGVCFL